MTKVSAALVLVLCATFGLVSMAAAAWVSVGTGAGLGSTVLESSPSRIVLEFTLGGFDRTDVTIGGQTWSQLRIPGAAIHQELGLPELPLAARSVIVPDDRKMSLRVVSSEHVDLTGIDPAPSKGNLMRTVDPAQVPHTFGSFYATSEWYPATQAFAREPYILRDYRGVTVVVSPIQYQPSTHTLRVYTRLEVELVDDGPGGANVLTRTLRSSALTPEFTEIYQAQFLNFDSQARYQTVPEVGSILVITYDDFASAVQPYVDWKNQMGVPTTMVLKSAVGTTSTQFKTYIQNAYNASSSPKLAFVLLVGDATQIPSLSSDGGTSDPSYSKVAGGDNYPDIFIGRFSAENLAQAQTQVTRTINYEKEPLLAGTAWYPKGTGIGSQYGTGDDGEYDWEHIDNIGNQLLTYGYTLVDPIYGASASAAMVTTALNNGRTVVNYCGHGSATSWGTTGFSNTNVNALQNDNMLPFIFSVACVNGEFSGMTCFAEAWMRATHNGAATGAVAFYGSSIDQSWNPPMEAQDEANLLLVTDAVRTFGAYCYNGSCSMMDSYGADGRSMFNTWHIFGDPSLRLRTQAPTSLTVDHSSNIAPDASTFELDVPGVEGALCALSYQHQYFGSAFTDQAGHAVIPVVGTLPEGADMDLTVTGYNRIPYIAPLTVETPLVPNLLSNPTAYDLAVPLGGSAVETLRVHNMGDPGSVLNFVASFAADVRPPWATLDPESGSIPYGDSLDVLLTVSTTRLHNGVYEGKIVFEYNPSQITQIPVHLTVGDISGVGDSRGQSLGLRLEPASPTPFRGATVLHFNLPREESVRLAIYDASGRSVRLLAEGPLAAGSGMVAWDGRDDAGRSVPTGVYFAHLATPEGSLTTRLLRVR